MKRVLVLFLAVLIWRGSRGFAVWNQKPAQLWPESSLSLFGGQLPRPDVQTATSTSGSPQAPTDSTGQSADSPNRLNPSSCGTVSQKSLLVPSQTGQLNSPVSSSQSGGLSLSLQPGSGSSQYTAQSSSFQGFAGSPQTTSTSGFHNQAFPSSASSQGVSSGSALASQRQSNDQSASGSNWFVSSGQGVPSMFQTQTLRPVPQVVQGSALQTQVSQASPQGVASKPAPLVEQQSYDQSARGSSWFSSSGQEVSQVPQTLRPVVQGFQVSTRGVAGVPTPLAQQLGYDQSASSSTWFDSLGQGVPSSQGLNVSVVLVSGPQALPQGVASVSAPSAQQQSYDQSASGSSWFVSSGQRVSSVPQTLRNVLQEVQDSQASPQGVASVSAPSAQQQSYDQSAGGFRWFGSLGQGVSSSQGQNAPVSQTKPFWPVPNVVQGLGHWAVPQGVVGVSASPAQQWHYDPAASLVASQVQGPSQSTTAVQTQLPRPAPGNVASLLITAQDANGLQPSGSSSWNTQHQNPSSVSTQFQPSQNAAQVSQASQSPVPRKWFHVMPSGFTPSWSSGSPSAWVTANNNPYASLSQVASPSADAMFQSGGLGSAIQPSAVSTTNSAAGSPSQSLTSWPPAAVVSSGPISISALPSQNTWQSTGPSQSVLQSSSSVGLPGASSNLLSSVASRFPISYPGTTSSFNLVPSQASDASAQRVPVNQLNFNAARTSSGFSAKLH